MTEINEIGKRIKTLRTLRGFSQTALGQELGLVKQTVSTIENGQRKATTEELEKIAKFLNVPVMVFYDDSLYKNFEQDKTPTMKNKWGIEVPYIVEDIIYGLDQHFEYIVNSGTLTPKQALKHIENIIKLFKLYKKDYKEENNLWTQ